MSTTTGCDRCAAAPEDDCTDLCPSRRAAPEPTLPLMVDPSTAKALTIAGRKAAQWTAERDRLIRKAVVEEKGTLREVGALAGISHTAVSFIAHGRPGR